MNHCSSSTCVLVSAASVLLLTAGCGGPYDSTVNGLVKFDGNPLPRGTVSFIPQSQGPPAYGMIGDDGMYKLRTGREEGLKSGSYIVTVAANEQTTVNVKNGGPPPLGKPITPEWYRNPTTSGLNFTVKPGKNEINLELSKTPPPGWKPATRRR
jgi:hypothetical protein